MTLHHRVQRTLINVRPYYWKRPCCGSWNPVLPTRLRCVMETFRGGTTSLWCRGRPCWRDSWMRLGGTVRFVCRRDEWTRKTFSIDSGTPFTFSYCFWCGSSDPRSELGRRFCRPSSGLCVKNKFVSLYSVGVQRVQSLILEESCVSTTSGSGPRKRPLD